MYTKILQRSEPAVARFLGNPHVRARAIILQRHSGMPMILADRFVASGAAWIDLATGDSVRVHVASAGSAREQMEWDARCAALANLRHPLINPLLDYGAAGEGRTFEAYAAHGPVHGRGATGEILLAHAVRFLQAHAVGLVRPRADYVLRPVAGNRQRADTADLEAGVRPVGIVLQRRNVFDAIVDALDAARPGGVCAVSIAGAAQSGLRTLQLVAARAARIHGYVPVAPSALARYDWLADRLLSRHVCVIDAADDTHRHTTGQEELVASLLTRLGSAGPRRHVVFTFLRAPECLSAPAIQVDPLGMRAMTGMIFLDREHGPSAGQLFEAARRSEGRPGKLLEHLGAFVSGQARAAMVAHETAEPYLVTRPGPQPAGVRREGRTAALLRRSVERGEALARIGRHAAAWRVLSRAARVLCALGEHANAARCAVSLGWLAIDRARLDDARRAFEEARDRYPDGVTSVTAAIGLGVASTDDGRLLEAEAALRTSMVAAGKLDDRTLVAQSAAALGRCLYWQGRYDEAAAALRGAGDACGSPSDAARVAWTMARVHLAEGAIPAAVRAARHARDLAATSSDPRALTSASRMLAVAVAAAGDPESARQHIRDGLRAARDAHLPLAAARLRIAWVDIQTSSASPTDALVSASRLAEAGARWPRLLRFHARAVCARSRGIAIDAETAAFMQSGAVAIGRAVAPAAVNPVADLEAFLALGQTASDDGTAVERICDELRNRLRAATVVVVAGPERRVIVQCGKPWHGDPHVAWRALAGGLSIAPEPAMEPCHAAEPLRYSGDVIAALAARWTAGTMLEPARATAILRVGALASAANVRAMLDRASPEGSPAPWEDFLGDSAAAQSLREAITRAARAPFPVLIEGESGSGKELVARAIHRLGPRRDRRFCALNCAALTDDLLEAELFGHARGAFTGAVGERQGLFEEADGGTLFLDEIGELSGRAQAKLLRVLQDGEVRRVGENMFRHVDVRIVAATNRRLEHEVATGRFRADLRFRLDVVRIDVPPLRDRAGDVPLLASRFWNDAAARVGSRATLSPDAIAALARYDWPGNVRELQNVIAWMAVHSPRRGRVGPAALPRHLAQATAPSTGTFEAARAEFERRFVKAALASADGQRARAAQALGVTRQGLAKMMRRLGLDGR